MLKKVALVGVTAAAIVGTGTAALAASGSSTPAAKPAATPAASASAGAKMKHKHGGFGQLRGAVQATWVTENKKTSTFVTHDAIRGTVTAVSPTSITVSAANKATETYSVSSTTKIHTRAAKTGAVIGDVKVGDTAVVAGTGTSSFAATQIMDTAK